MTNLLQQYQMGNNPGAQWGFNNVTQQRGFNGNSMGNYGRGGKYESNWDFDNAPGWIQGIPGMTENGWLGMDMGQWNSLAGFGMAGLSAYGGLKQLGLAEDQFELYKKQSALDTWNKSQLAKDRLLKQGASLASAQGRPVDRSYQDTASKIRTSV